VLNRSYVAVRVVSVRRAFVMLFRDAAEVIHVEDGAYANYDFQSWCELSQLWTREIAACHSHADWVRAVNFSILAPRIIRLLLFDQVPRQSVRLNRRTLFARDGNRCQYCGDSYPNSQLSLDHVTPRSRGGDTCWENVVTCCLTCNSRKGDRTPQEAGMSLRIRPTRPKHNPMLKIKLGNPRYHIWRPFLSQAGCTIEVV
jgi:5-methylcytosine-specific restriction endonuclease McrA